MNYMIDRLSSDYTSPFVLCPSQAKAPSRSSSTLRASTRSILLASAPRGRRSPRRSNSGTDPPSRSRSSRPLCSATGRQSALRRSTGEVLKEESGLQSQASWPTNSFTVIGWSSRINDKDFTRPKPGRSHCFKWSNGRAYYI